MSLHNDDFFDETDEPIRSADGMVPFFYGWRIFFRSEHSAKKTIPPSTVTPVEADLYPTWRHMAKKPKLSDIFGVKKLINKL